MRVEDLGVIPYREAWDYQEELREARRLGKIPDTFLFCEHPPVFTVGRQDCRDDWRATFDHIRNAGIDVVEANRGGRITYHGPGQIIGYFIFDLTAQNLGVRAFVDRIEELLIRSVAPFGISATRDAINPGIWVEDNKLGAIGLHISRGISQHGFALNHSPRMSDYQYIVPCGIANRGVTSMRELLGERLPTRADVQAEIVSALKTLIVQSQTPS